MIELAGVTKRFGSAAAVSNITFAVGPGEAVVVLGPSGSGKTTLLRLVAGLEAPDEGEIRIEAVVASGRRRLMPPHERSIGFVFQQPTLWPHMTAAQNVGFGLTGMSRSAASQRAREMLELTGTVQLADRYPDEISGGEARRGGGAPAHAPRPKRLLMDEPLTNLDPELRARMLGLVQQAARDTEASLLYVTHDADEADAISGRRLSLLDGCLVAGPGEAGQP